MNRGKIIAGLLIGAAAAATVNLLLSSEKGSETLNKVKEKKDAYTETVKEKIVNFLFSLIDTITAPGKKEVGDQAEAGSEKATG